MKVNRLFASLQKIQGRPTLEMFRERERNQWDGSDTIKNRQFIKLKKLLEDSYNNVPYYHELFDKKGIDPAKINSYEDFSRDVPLLKRDILSRDIGKFHSRQKQGKLIIHNTGGSSGQPLAFPRAKDSIGANWADYMITRSWWGISIGDPMAKIWGHWHKKGGIIQNVLVNIKDWIRSIVMGEILLSAYNMTDEEMDRFARKMKKHKPQVIYGYASAMEKFGHYIKDNDINLDLPENAILIPTSEPLFDSSRTFLLEVFKRPVSIEYGTCEVGLIACECPEGHLHILHDSLIVESIDTNGNPAGYGVPGEIVVTGLYSSAVPLIRYSLGDVATLSDEKCPCGRGGDLIKEIHGRTWSMIKGVNGNIVYPQIITALVMSYFPGTRRFQAVQDRKDHVMINIERPDSFQAESIGRLVSELETLLGSEMNIDVHNVEIINPELSGKFVVVKSLI